MKKANHSPANDFRPTVLRTFTAKGKPHTNLKELVTFEQLYYGEQKIAYRDVKNQCIYGSDLFHINFTEVKVN